MTLQERLRFKAWAATHDMDLTPTPIACYSGIYSDCNTDYAWLAWQAATLAERERCAKVCEQVKSETVMSKYATTYECGAARSIAEQCADTIRRGEQ